MSNKRIVAIASKHGKEEVMEPLLSRGYGLQTEVAGIDTDVFGTFDGEIGRKGSPLEVARKKCLAAMQKTGRSMAIASEGSFGMDPTTGMIPINDELVLLVDEVSGREYMGWYRSLNTNFAGQWVNNLPEALQFAEKIGFPDHGLILKQAEHNSHQAVKGIRHADDLKHWLEVRLEQWGKLWVETDMRASFNPTRMKNIAKATQQLVENLNSLCPECWAPGFAKVQSITGKPCASCYSPTNSIKAWGYACFVCGYEESRAHTEEQPLEDPMYCIYCNP